MEINLSTGESEKLQSLSWGRISYEQAWAQQKELVEKRIRNEIPDTLIFCEHDPVITLGRGSQREGAETFVNIDNIPVHKIERGGLATYHGPGQLVMYPIFYLGKDKHGNPNKRGVLGLIRGLEYFIVEYLKSKNLDAGVIEGKTGVWVDGSRKIASIGIAARHWVSYHGLSLNVSTGKEPWMRFNPCGFEGSIMTDLNSETHISFELRHVEQELLNLALNIFE